LEEIKIPGFVFHPHILVSFLLHSSQYTTPEPRTPGFLPLTNARAQKPPVTGINHTLKQCGVIGIPKKCHSGKYTFTILKSRLSNGALF
jgi:hypothetical protein